MAHAQQIDYCQTVKKRFPDFFRDALVLDVGSLDVNGNNQHLFEDVLYLGVDVAPGKNIDIVTKGHELLLPDETFDVIISTECFEHDRHYAETLRNICRLLKPGGMFVFTCATEGRPEHGTRRTSPQDAPLLSEYLDWQDYYRNLTEGDIREAVDIDNIFYRYEFSVNNSSHDLYFWGIKKGDGGRRRDYSFQIVRPSLHVALNQAKEIADLRVEAAKAQKELEALAQELTEEKASRAELDAELSARNAAVAQLKAEAAETRAALDAARAARAAVMTEMNRLVEAYHEFDDPALRSLIRIVRRSVRLGRRISDVARPGGLLPGRRRQRRRKENLKENARLIAESGLFDRDWYLKRYPDVAHAGKEPVLHYLTCGAAEGRNPNSHFDGDWYLREYPDVAATGFNPLMHYLLYGKAEKRATSPGHPIQSKMATLMAARGLSPIGQDYTFVADLHFPEIEQPEISVIIPVYNQIAYTAACLRSLAEQSCDDTFEVIVMDDCSSDETAELITRVRGLRYIRNDTNLGFIRNCNRGAEFARGRFLVFLNNDTDLFPGWLQALRDTFREHDRVGAVGSQLIYSDGRLQEAGGIIWEDGSGWNWGRLKDPLHPRYNFVRDVDYVSGASLMVPRELFFEVGKFSEHLQNSYYEDTYLAFALRDAGYRVLYQPRSKLIHYEGISSGTDQTRGTKKYQVVNQNIFLARWKDALSTHMPNGVNPEKASDRTVRGHILIVDAVTPTPDRDSGSIDMFNLIRILTDLGYRVHFIPVSNFALFGHYTEALQEMSVECVYTPYYTNIRSYLAERGDMFDYVIMARVSVAEGAIDVVKALAPSASTIFYTVDMHGLREIREAELEGDRRKNDEAQGTWRRELKIVNEADVTIVLSHYEAEILEKGGHKNIAVLPLIRTESECGTLGFDKRRDIVFLGGFQHKPNIDAVNWLLDDIWPRVCSLLDQRGLERFSLKLVGSAMPEWIRQKSTDDVVAVGYVEDLDELFNSIRLSVAPLRYGAGLKGKVATSLGYGVPTVGTDIAFEGMPTEYLDSVRVTENDADRLAEAIVDIYYNESRWSALSEAGPRYVNRNYSVDVLKSRVEEILSHADAQKARRSSRV